MSGAGRETQHVDVWVHHIRVGILMSLLGAAAVLGYAAAPPSRPGDAGLAALAVAVALYSALLLRLPLHRLAAHRLRPRMLVVWTAVTSGVVVVAVLLDGGAGSPLVWLNCLTLVHATGTYAPQGTAVIGGAAVVSYAAIAVVGSPVSVGRVVMTLTTLVLLTLLCALTSESYWAQRRRQAELAERLAALADEDGLTGCLNHRAFHERLREEVGRATRYGQPLSLLLADLDHFKAVNDAFGHPVGDAVLATVAGLLRDLARDVDVVARLGGEEFALLLPATGIDDAVSVATRLRSSVAALRDPVGVTVCVGISAIPAPARGALDLLEQADIALYEGKRSGRDHVTTFRPGLLEVTRAEPAQAPGPSSGSSGSSSAGSRSSATEFRQ
ncbi:MAG: GGDEF domain-containing protein [Actinobacteria bacterium]|nr:GGDEF domain-containing protein [Actinomycetota bacterium]